MNIDLAKFTDEMDTRAKNVARLAPRAAAVTLRLTRLASEIAAVPARHAGNTKFSAEGRRDLVRADLEKIAPKFGLAKAAVERNRAAISTNCTTLEKSAFSKSEADPMGPEIRGMLRTLGHGKAVQEASKSPQVLAAIVNAPIMLHGVARDAVQHLVDAHLAAHHASEVARLEAQAEACTIAESTLQTVTHIFSDAGAFTIAGDFAGTRALDSFLSEHAPSANDLAAEAAGGLAAGGRKIGMTDSFQLIMSDALENEPA